MKRSPMKPGKGFKKPDLPVRAPVVHRPLQVTPNYNGATTGPVAKDVKAKPGKRAPTKEEEKWLKAIVSFGCIACWLDGCIGPTPAVHHLLRGGQRMGHLYSIPLCDPGHHQQGQSLGMISRHPWKTRFETKYGCEKNLLHGLQRKLGFPVLEWKE